MQTWITLLNDKRFSQLLERQDPSGKPSPPSFAANELRNPFERDHDRILFSTPFRRMGDKTQVFPLESIESIRTRLTHSYEVSNLCRSIGIRLVEALKPKLPPASNHTIPPILAAVGLAHDIGNPPFGHQGENAIRSWFRENNKHLFNPSKASCSDNANSDISSLTEQHKQDFLLFEGNAQTLRVVTKLQVIGDDLGLDLTLGTLASLMKYVASSDSTKPNNEARKKVGYFASEQALVNTIRSELGLQGDALHPLAYVMSACDDIAYSVLDAEDSIKKGLVSFHDLMAWLKTSSNEDCIINYIREVSEWERMGIEADWQRSTAGKNRRRLYPSELSDVATQKFRAHAIHVMVFAVVEAFARNHDGIIGGRFRGSLVEHSQAGPLYCALTEFNREHAFKHRSVLSVELEGHAIINRLMDHLWIGISERKKYANLASERASPFAAYVYSRISRNYRRVFEGTVSQYHGASDLPIRYREMQLLTDMVSGMTDRFCIDMYRDFERHCERLRPE